MLTDGFASYPCASDDLGALIAAALPRADGMEWQRCRPRAFDVATLTREVERLLSTT